MSSPQHDRQFLSFFNSIKNDEDLRAYPEIVEQIAKVERSMEPRTMRSGPVINGGVSGNIGYLVTMCAQRGIKFDEMDAAASWMRQWALSSIVPRNTSRNRGGSRRSKRRSHSRKHHVNRRGRSRKH